MKKTFLLIALGLFIVSCSNDDDSNNNDNTSTSYFPSNEGNYWVYDVNSDIMDGRDSLYIANDTLINSDTYQKLETKNLPFGFFSNSLRNNAVKDSGGKIFVTGAVGFNISEDIPLSLPINNFVVFDQNAANNQELGTISGTMEQEIEGYTLEFSYSLTSKAKADIPTFTSGTETYTNIKPVEITVNLSINVKTEFAGLPITFPLMTSQNVVVSTQYYAPEIGVVKTITDLSYELTQIPNIELPIPQSGSEHQEEILVDYSIQ